MPASAKSSAPALPPEGIVALGLALPPRRQAQHPLQLLALLPFLALGWRAAVVHAMARGWGAVSAMPWLGIRWLPWLEASRATTPPTASLAQALGQPPGEARAPVETHRRAESAEVLAALAPMLGIAAAHRGQLEGSAGPESQHALARTSPFLTNPPVRPAATPLPGLAAAMVVERGGPAPRRVQADQSPAEAVAAKAQRPEDVPQAAEGSPVRWRLRRIRKPGSDARRLRGLGRVRTPSGDPWSSSVWQVEKPTPAPEITAPTGISHAAADVGSPETPAASAAARIIRQQVESSERRRL